MHHYYFYLFQFLMNLILIICGFAAYLRNITLRPSLFKDWLYFLFTILVANSINYFLLVNFFSIELNYYELSGNILFTPESFVPIIFQS